MLSRTTYIHSCMILAAMMVAVNVCAMNTNLSRPYNIFFKPERKKDTRSFFTMFVEGGIGHAKGFDEDGSTNVMRIFNSREDGIAMLQGFSESSPQGQLLDKIQGVNVAPIDNGIRGNFLVSGDMKLDYGIGFGWRYFFPNDFSIGLYIPMYSMRLKNVCWQDQTPSTTPADPDVRVKQYLTDNFFANVSALGDGLSLKGWHRTGVGDLVALLEWDRDFPQPRPLLKNVRLNARLGLNIPTGLRADEDKLFALAFGCDGATGIIFGADLAVTFGDYMRAGVDVELLPLFGTVSSRRIKTDFNQTQSLLLEKTCVYTDWAMIQQFNIFVKFADFYKGFKIDVDYQFLKQGSAQMTPLSPAFPINIVNTGRNLEEWTAHDVIVKLGYDFKGTLREDARVAPTISFFAQMPFNGKNSILFTAAGVLLAAEF